MLLLLAVILFIGSLAGMGLVFYRKFRLLGAINVDSIPAVRDAALKDRLIASRIKRKLRSFKAFAEILAEPLSKGKDSIQSVFSRVYLLLLDLRERHRLQLKVGGSTAHEGEASDIDSLLQRERVVEAEKRCLALLEHDPTSAVAAAGLLKVSLLKKEPGNAQDMAKYLTKLLCKKMKSASPEELAHCVSHYTESLADLANLSLDNGDTTTALAAIRQAIKLQENNPKYLDLLIRVHLARKERLKAEKAVSLLEKANPENQKIIEFGKSIEELSY